MDLKILITMCGAIPFGFAFGYMISYYQHRQKVENRIRAFEESIVLLKKTKINAKGAERQKTVFFTDRKINEDANIVDILKKLI